MPVQYHPGPRLPRRWTTGAPGIASTARSELLDVHAAVRDPRSARSALPAGGVAGDRDPGDRSGDARLCRVCDLGAHGAGGCVEPVGNPVPSTEREDVPIGPSAAGSRGSGSPAGRVLHRGGRSAGHPVRVAGGGPGREDIARRAARRRCRRPSGVGVRPPRRLVLGQLAVAEKSNEIPCVRKLLKLFRAGAAAGHRGCHAHADRDRETNLLDTEIALPDDREVQPAHAARAHPGAPCDEVPVTPPTTITPTAASRRRTLQILTAAEESDSRTPIRLYGSPANAS